MPERDDCLQKLMSKILKRYLTNERHWVKIHKREAGPWAKAIFWNGLFHEDKNGCERIEDRYKREGHADLQYETRNRGI